MTTATIALASLRHRMARVAFAALTFAISLATLVLTFSATARVSRSLAGFDKPRISIFSPLERSFPQAYARKVADRLHLSSNIEWVRFFSGGGDGKRFNFVVWALTAGYPATFPTTIVDITPAETEAWTNDRRGVLVTQGVLDRLGWKVGQTAVLQLGFANLEVHVIGLIRGALEDTVFVHYEYADPSALHPGLAFFISIPSPRDQFDANSRAVEELFASSETPVMAVPARVLHGFYLRSTAAVPHLLEWIGLVIGLVAVFIHSSALTVSVAERRAELGTLRIMGFSRARIFAIICVESMATCLAGGVLGCVVPYLLWHKHGVEMGSLSMSNVTVDLEFCVAGMLVAAAAGVLTTIVPAVSFFRADLLESVTKE